MSEFCHLHLHTHFSILDGLTKIHDLMGHVKSMGQKAVAITDHGSMAGMVEFIREAKEAGVLPIVGLETYVTKGSRHVKEGGRDSTHLTLLAKTSQGVKNLMKLSSLAH